MQTTWIVPADWRSEQWVPEWRSNTACWWWTWPSSCWAWFLAESGDQLQLNFCTTLAKVRHIKKVHLTSFSTHTHTHIHAHIHVHLHLHVRTSQTATMFAPTNYHRLWHHIFTFCRDVLQVWNSPSIFIIYSWRDDWIDSDLRSLMWTRNYSTGRNTRSPTIIKTVSSSNLYTRRSTKGCDQLKLNTIQPSARTSPSNINSTQH